jgi:hypothetical protein
MGFSSGPLVDMVLNRAAALTEMRRANQQACIRHDGLSTPSSPSWRESFEQRPTPGY